MEIRKNLPLGLLMIYFAKVCLQPVNLPEVGILLILAGLVSYLEYKNSDKKLVAIEENVATLKKDIEEKTKEIESMKTYVTGLKLQNTMKLGGLGGR